MYGMIRPGQVSNSPIAVSILNNGVTRAICEIAEERRQRVDRQRQGERDVRDDQTGPGVEQPDRGLDLEQRRHEGDLRDRGRTPTTCRSPAAGRTRCTG